MNKGILYFGILGISLSFVYADKQRNEWHYGANASQDWANISPLYLGCAQGNQQSPINIITKNVVSGATSFEIQYTIAKGINLTLENATFKILYPRGSFLKMGGLQYQLKEIHFKTPAENSIDSLHAPLEVQFFHEDSKGHKVVVAVFFMEGRANGMLDSIIKNLPVASGKAHFITNIDANAFIPSNLASYQFDGSLTTPPCSQGIRWIVIKQPMSATLSQIDTLRRITNSNARPTQESFNRLIVE